MSYQTTDTSSKPGVLWNWTAGWFTKKSPITNQAKILPATTTTTKKVEKQASRITRLKNNISHSYTQGARLAGKTKKFAYNYQKYIAYSSAMLTSIGLGLYVGFQSAQTYPPQKQNEIIGCSTIMIGGISAIACSLIEVLEVPKMIRNFLKEPDYEFSRQDIDYLTAAQSQEVKQYRNITIDNLMDKRKHYYKRIAEKTIYLQKINEKFAELLEVLTKEISLTEKELSNQRENIKSLYICLSDTSKILKKMEDSNEEFNKKRNTLAANIVQYITNNKKRNTLAANIVQYITKDQGKGIYFSPKKPTTAVVKAADLSLRDLSWLMGEDTKSTTEYYKKEKFQFELYSKRRDFLEKIRKNANSWDKAASIVFGLERYKDYIEKSYCELRCVFNEVQYRINTCLQAIEGENLGLAASYRAKGGGDSSTLHIPKADEYMAKILGQEAILFEAIKETLDKKIVKENFYIKNNKVFLKNRKLEADLDEHKRKNPLSKKVDGYVLTETGRYILEENHEDLTELTNKLQKAGVHAEQINAILNRDVAIPTEAILQQLEMRAQFVTTLRNCNIDEAKVQEEANKSFPECKYYFEDVETASIGQLASSVEVSDTNIRKLLNKKTEIEELRNQLLKEHGDVDKRDIDAYIIEHFPIITKDRIAQLVEMIGKLTTARVSQKTINEAINGQFPKLSEFFIKKNTTTFSVLFPMDANTPPPYQSRKDRISSLLQNAPLSTGIHCTDEQVINNHICGRRCTEWQDVDLKKLEQFISEVKEKKLENNKTTDLLYSEEYTEIIPFVEKAKRAVSFAQIQNRQDTGGAGVGLSL